MSVGLSVHKAVLKGCSRSQPLLCDTKLFERWTESALASEPNAGFLECKDSETELLLLNDSAIRAEVSALCLLCTGDNPLVLSQSEAVTQALNVCSLHKTLNQVFVYLIFSLAFWRRSLFFFFFFWARLAQNSLCIPRLQVSSTVPDTFCFVVL